MKIALLDPLEGIARELVTQHFDAADLMIAPNKEELPAGLADAEVIVWSNWPVDRALIESLPKLRLLQRLGRFRARGDVTAAFERGLPVSVLPHGTGGRVGEHVVALIMGLMRGLLRSDRSVRDGLNPADLEPLERLGSTPTFNWTRVPGLTSLYFKTVGIAGFGEIGAVVALHLQSFGCRVLYNKRTRLTPEEERYFGVGYASFDDLLRHSDVVVNLIPVSDATRGTFVRAQFEAMKPTAFFINTGRGPTADEIALIDALREGRIAGAGLDVFDLEPLPPGHPLTNLDNVILTPHTAGGTPQGASGGYAGWNDTYAYLRENIRRVEAGEPVLSPMRLGDPQPGG
jgi:phosphoglycerate dehydrogenase-like enzyme